MNYWTELGWLVLPMNGIEIGFTVAMCFVTSLLDKRRK